MIPSGLNRDHILKSIQEIDKNGIPKTRKSYKYDLVINNKRYPPKYVISIANKFLTGVEYSHQNFNAVEAKDYFRRRGYKVIEKLKEESQLEIQSEDFESKYAEGKEKYRQHRILERDSSITKKAKEQRALLDNELKCDVCGFSFVKTYGKLGEGYIEAHHLLPISMNRGRMKTTLQDIALLCANCHRMIHNSNKILSIDDLKRIVSERRS